MANTFTSAATGSNTNLTTLYTCPVSTTGIVHAIYVSNIDGINDLRTYDGYPSDSSNFLLPYENFVKVTHNALTADNDYSDKMVSYVYAFLSMLHDRLGFDISIAKKVLTNKYSITLKDAINLIDAEGFGKFDKDYFIMVMNKSL